MVVDVDAAIDIVAREMTALDAPTDLKVRVLAEIESAAARTAWWRTPVWATAAAAALLAALIWIWPQPTPTPASQQATVTPSAVTQPSTEQPVRAAVPSSTSASQQLVVGAPQRRPVAGRTVSADVMTASEAESTGTDDEPWVVVEMLPDPNPISIGALSVSPVEITTLTIPELRIDPVDPGLDPDKR
jgi:hypothetical protein